MKVTLALSFFLLIAVGFPEGNAKLATLELSSGHNIPIVGLGTSTIKLEDMEKAILSALESGYRHIDTAYAYDNEESIGQILKKWFQQGGKREDLFITSKLPSHGNRPQSVEKYLTKSLNDLGLSYVDMYLIHTPFGVKEGENMFPKTENGNEIFENVDHVALWKEMEKQVKKGRAKSIGLSNFNQSQVLNVYNNAEIKPSNLQVECHAYLQQPELKDFCRDHKIVVTAYAPLGSQVARKSLHSGTDKELLPPIELSSVKALSHKYKKSPGQILLRYNVQRGYVVIPKSSNPKRIKENIDIFDFELTDEDMKTLNKLDKGEKGRVFDFLAFYTDLDKNPQYPFGGQS